MSGLDGHGGPGHSLLPRAAEAVDGYAGGLHRPSGGENGHAADARSVIAGVVAVADDHVIDVGRVESHALLKRVEHLREQLLGVDVVQ